LILTVMVSSTKKNAKKPASRCVNVVRTGPKDVQGDPLRVDEAGNLATKGLMVRKVVPAETVDLVVRKVVLVETVDLVVRKVVPAETVDLVVRKVVLVETVDLVVRKVVPAETVGLVVRKVVPAETVDLVVRKVVPAETAVHKDMHRLTWVKCSTSSTKIAMVR
jgi:hypothetical protein